MQINRERAEKIRALEAQIESYQESVDECEREGFLSLVEWYGDWIIALNDEIQQLADSPV